MRKKLLKFLTMSEDTALIYSCFYNLLFCFFFLSQVYSDFFLVICFFTNKVANDIRCHRCRFKSVQLTSDSHTLSYFYQSVVSIWEANLSMFLFMIASRKLPLLEWKHFKQWEIGSLWPIWHSYWVKSLNTLTSWCDKTVAKMFTVRKNMNCFHACCYFVLKNLPD